MEHLKYHGNVCISGLTASGKTTHSHMLAGEFGLTYISGSQIQLNFLGVSPIQTRDFWIKSEAKGLWDKDQFRKIDDELLKLETAREGCIFDTSTMPWRHNCPSLNIWLGSTLQSRVIKSIVSHHGRGGFVEQDYPSKIAEKDRATTQLYKELYDIKIGDDLSCFNLILDISDLIEDATIQSSLYSIDIAHRVIRPAAAYYLTNSDIFKQEYLSAVDKYGNIVKHDSVLEAANELYNS